MSRTARWRLGLGVSAVLLASAALPAPAHAEDATDYSITVDPSAQGAGTGNWSVQAGQEGFLVPFGVKDTGNYYWWNIGGWNNTQAAVEQAVDGGKSTLIAKPGSVETGRAYDVDIKVRGRQVTLYLDGQQWGGFTDDKPAEPFRQVVTRDAKTGELIVKVVNDQSSAARTAVDLGGAKVASRAKATTLAAAPDAVNSETCTAVAPRTSTVTAVADKFTYTFPANSITFLRIRQK